MVVTAAVVGAMAFSAQAATYFVNGTSGSDSAPGTPTWSQAVKTPQRAIQLAKDNIANAPHEIWVTAGTYYPDQGPGPVDSNDPLAFYEMVPSLTDDVVAAARVAETDERHQAASRRVYH
jgi:hypothetical protein